MAQPHIARSSIIPTAVKAATWLIHTGRTGRPLSLADVLLFANVVAANDIVAISVVSFMLRANVVAVVSLLHAVGVIEMVSAEVAVVTLLLLAVVSSVTVVDNVPSLLLADEIADNIAVKVGLLLLAGLVVVQILLVVIDLDCS